MNVENQWGYEIIEFISVNEKEAESNKEYLPLSSSMVLIEYESKYLIIHNKYRKQWELPSGGKETGESLRECAYRELKEETNQVASKMVFRGLFKVKDKKRDIIKYQGFFTGTLENIKEFLENDETDEIKFIKDIDSVTNFDSVDKEMIKIVKQTEVE